jgi:hypothetical protein
MPALTGLIPELATLAQSAEQTLRKRQVKGSNPLGGLIDVGRPQRFPVGAFAVSSTFDLQLRSIAHTGLRAVMACAATGAATPSGQNRQRYG